MIPIWPLLTNRYVLAAAAGAIVIAGATWAWNDKKQEWRQAGYDQAIAEVEVKQAEIDRELRKARSRLLDYIRELEKDNAANDKLVEDFRRRNADAAQRLLDQERDFDAKLQRASAEAVREYAKDSDRNLERCRGDVDRFAREAASCSGTAWTLKKYQDRLP